MAKASRSISLREEMCTNGEILYCTGKKDFVKVKTNAITIDKVLFSMVHLGTKGQGFDIYMDADLFDNWCDEILSNPNVFKAIIAREAQEGQQYPVYYKFITGENAEKSVGFCASRTAGCYTLNAKSGSEYVNIPIKFTDLQSMAKYWKRMWKHRTAMLDEKLMKALADNFSYHQNAATKVEPKPVEEEPTDAPAQQSKPVSAPAQSTNPEPLVVAVKVVSAAVEWQGKNAFEGADGNGKKRCFFYPTTMTPPNSVKEGNGIVNVEGTLSPDGRSFSIARFV